MHPPKLLPAIAALLFAGSLNIHAAAFIDMGEGQGSPTSPDSNGNSWNTYIATSGTLSLVTTANTSSGWSLTITGTGSGGSYSGSGIDPAATGAPAALAISGAYNDGYVDNTQGVGSTFSFTGLSANTEYSLTLWGYRGTTANSNDGTINFTVGTTSGGPFTLVPTEALTVNVTSNLDGEIAFLFDAAAGATGSKGAQINVMSLGVVPEPSTALLALFGIGSLVVCRRVRNA